MLIYHRAGMTSCITYLVLTNCSLYKEFPSLTCTLSFRVPEKNSYLQIFYQRISVICLLRSYILSVFIIINVLTLFKVNIIILPLPLFSFIFLSVLFILLIINTLNVDCLFAAEVTLALRVHKEMYKTKYGILNNI